ncbi:MAG: hypothetical protein ACFFAU_10865 [Candidatus Hodarchaeota archaeon]
MASPKVISIYSRTPSCGKKTIALNSFLAYTRTNPGHRVLIVDFSTTEKLRYSLLRYGKPQFTSMDFLSEISEDILVNEALTIFKDENEGSFLRVLPSAGCLITQPDLRSRVKYRINSLFFKDTIDLLIFILPIGLEENSIAMAAILQSDIVWIISLEKYPTLSLTKSTIQNFLTFITAPTFLIMNMVQPPIVLDKYQQIIQDMELKLRHPIFYSIAWLPEINNFTDNGIISLEMPNSKINEIFINLSNNFKEALEKESFRRKIDETDAPPPIALFITDRNSGATMYYYFFGKSEDEMKNPALITAAMTSIAHMVSETAGRRGDLRYIDNGNMKIVQRKGKHVIGILYSPVMNDTLTDLLFQFIKRFENEFNQEIEDFSKTGRISGFGEATNIVEEIFENYIFDIETVNDQLRQKILIYIGLKEQVNNDPEEVFRNFVHENSTNSEIKDLLLYEFITPHNARHDFLLELGINPRSKYRKLEEETGQKICSCTEPPKYVQIQAFDTLGMLSLPDSLRPTVRALFASNILSPETASKITNRDQSLEYKSLEELCKLGYVKRVTSQ